MYGIDLPDIQYLVGSGYSLHTEGHTAQQMAGPVHTVNLADWQQEAPWVVLVKQFTAIKKLTSNNQVNKNIILQFNYYNLN